MNLLETRISCDAIAANTRRLKDMVAPAQLMCVVKADGYNHGAPEVATVMARNGADQLGVATLAEAHQLRDAGITLPILCWIWSPEQDFSAAIDRDIDLAAVSMDHVRALIAEAVRRPAGTRVRVTVKIDTELHRSGIDEANWTEAFELLHACPQINVTGVFSHLACADDLESDYTDHQAEVFRRAIDAGRRVGLDLPVNHLAASPATLTRPDLHFDMVRPGLALYGHEPIAGLDHGLREAMTWIGSVTVVKPIAAGQGTSYNMTWHAPADGYLCVVPVGYADGLPRNVQGHLEVTIAGTRYPQVGRVCMDQIVVFLGDNSRGVAPGDEAIIFGPRDTQAMTATELACATGTINYEILCRPTGRSHRTYSDFDAVAPTHPTES